MPVDHITRSFLVLRGQRILLDADLATLFGLTTKRFNEQVKRNAARVPEDFRFRLSVAEVETLNRSQIAPGCQRRHPRFPPYAFTEHGTIMASMILNTPQAVEMSVYLGCAFVQSRELLSSNHELARRFARFEERPERRLSEHDRAIGAVLAALRELMHQNEPVPERQLSH